MKALPNHKCQRSFVTVLPSRSFITVPSRTRRPILQAIEPNHAKLIASSLCPSHRECKAQYRFSSTPAQPRGGGDKVQKVTNSVRRVKCSSCSSFTRPVLSKLIFAPSLFTNFETRSRCSPLTTKMSDKTNNETNRSLQEIDAKQFFSAPETDKRARPWQEWYKNEPSSSSRESSSGEKTETMLIPPEVERMMRKGDHVQA